MLSLTFKVFSDQVLNWHYIDRRRPKNKGKTGPQNIFPALENDCYLLFTWVYSQKIFFFFKLILIPCLSRRYQQMYQNNYLWQSPKPSSAIHFRSNFTATASSYIKRAFKKRLSIKGTGTSNRLDRKQARVSNFCKAILSFLK